MKDWRGRLDIPHWEGGGGGGKAKVSFNTFNTSTRMKHLKIRDKNSARGLGMSALFYLELLFRVEQTAEERQLKL